MKHSDFKIGMTFRCGNTSWLVTDIGSRVIVGIRPRKGWMAGPPYALLESVFDEEDILDCEPIDPVSTDMT